MFTVNKNSWHYRWLIKYNSLVEDKPESQIETYMNLPTDFCAYWRNVLLWPALRLGFNIIPYIALVVIAITTGVYGLTGMGFFLTTITILAIVITIGVLAVMAVQFLWKKTATATTNFYSKDELLNEAYKSYKEKYCQRVEYKD